MCRVGPRRHGRRTRSDDHGNLIPAAQASANGLRHGLGPGWVAAEIRHRRGSGRSVSWGLYSERTRLQRRWAWLSGSDVRFRPGCCLPSQLRSRPMILPPSLSTKRPAAAPRERRACAADHPSVGKIDCAAVDVLVARRDDRNVVVFGDAGPALLRVDRPKLLGRHCHLCLVLREHPVLTIDHDLGRRAVRKSVTGVPKQALRPSPCQTAPASGSHQQSTPALV
jgi:hypothetical protein